MRLEPGDIVFTAARGGGFLSRQIDFWTRTWFEKPTVASHVALVVESGAIAEDTLMVEMTWPQVRRTVLGAYRDARVRIVRDLRLTEAERHRIAAGALAARGRYGAGKILLFLLDAIIGRIISVPWILVSLLRGRPVRGLEPRIFSRLNLTGEIVCSHLVARLWWQEGYHFGREWIAVTPDDLMDFCEARPERFRNVGFHHYSGAVDNTIQQKR